MLKFIAIVVTLLIISVSCDDYDGCENGWFRYEITKCVYIFNFESTYDEAETYCIKNFGAKMLNITDDDERRFWSFHLVRFSNISHNVWLQKPSSLKSSNQCLALRSKYSDDSHKAGSIIKQDCEALGTTVCEIATNKPLKTKQQAKEYNPNELMVPNRQLKYANGTLSEFYTGVYYVITSKYKNATFSNKNLFNGKCSLTNQGSTCQTMYQDKDIDDKHGSYFMFSSDNDKEFQIRPFNSDKLLIFDPDKYLSNYQCGPGSLSKDGLKICKQVMKDDRVNDLWKLVQFNNSDYYMIKSSQNDYTLGAKSLDHVENGTVGFGLFGPVDEKCKDDVKDEFLFKIESLNYTLRVELFTISFDKSLESVVQASKQQISIVDTAVINNNSPATLTHEVASTKEITESYSTSFGFSQQFMDTFSQMAEISKGLSDSNSNTQSFQDTTSQAVSSTLSHTISNTDSVTNEHLGNTHSDSGGSFSAGISIDNMANVGGEVHGGSGVMNGHANSKTSSSSTDDTNSNSNSKDNSHTNSNETNHGHETNTNEKNSKESTKQKSSTTDKRVEQSGSSQRTYSVYKTVSLPPYSSVRISSYANWINDLQIPFNLTLKFSVKSFRKQMDASGLNYWRTMDSAFVKHIMKLHLFNGNIRKEFFDSVYGEISGYLRASVGLESVFIATERKINAKNDFK